jgi:ABC-type lipoprotein release transport system permease subunit
LGFVYNRLVLLRGSVPRALASLFTLFVSAFAGMALAGPARLIASADLPEVLLSRQLAEQTHLRVGDVVTIAADPHGHGTMTFKVAGVYEPTPDPMRFSARRLDVRLHLTDLQALTADASDPLAAETVNQINLRLVRPEDASATAADAATRGVGLFARPTVSSSDEGQVFAVIDRFHRAIALVTVLGSTAFLLALMVIRAEERREVVGVLRLIGVPVRSILLEVLIEGSLIAAAGALFGLTVAWLGQGAVNRFFQWRYDTTLQFVHVSRLIALESVLFAVPLGVVAGLAASWTLLRRELVALIRR